MSQAAEAATTLLFIVSDTGIGIPAEKDHPIFQAFTQADAASANRPDGTPGVMARRVFARWIRIGHELRRRLIRWVHTAYARREADYASHGVAIDLRAS